MTDGTPLRLINDDDNITRNTTTRTGKKAERNYLLANRKADRKDEIQALMHP